ncbi:hypothetical protein [Pseudoalteromonas sp. GABNS16H]|uniref:hypothetical protein n=1 Tax=Pseudoalteromonas sp. GABNS16H TaxID=3025325 RepID=UPI00235FE051|nr:hypothetical protein [Pseudoalteromonas sp. GABNS16H]MDC9611923.1 hypothetical protein [Pseudoalteromonas sp. GABNS16H]
MIANIALFFVIAILSLVGSFVTYGYEGNVLSMLLFSVAIVCMLVATVISYLLMKQHDPQRDSNTLGSVESVSSKVDIAGKIVLCFLIAAAIIQAV